MSVSFWTFNTVYRWTLWGGSNNKLEWEFSRFINQMVTITLTYNEISPAEDSRADLDESI
jgi:hypothetical protein